ncbi:C2H2 type zinc finger containing protein [Colletotrichum kahawae]|uniref:C2H2 type zinc finger containing protein n=1 Tax=Colletotrichum kahawae TaxID=34407 RepID=A0AAE0D0V3_COLKA|nr:C2H2 type zinc finger containing protein [Colletotrichum kahawae]
MAAPSNSAVPPKIGTRFSRDTARLLKQWLNTHSHYPYPSQTDRQSLQLSTGLSKTQISNWLANARRRQKSLANATSARSPWSDESGAHAPRRPGTPIPNPTRIEGHYPDMDPMERWVDSPPEDEPAAVDDIARAIASVHTAKTFSGDPINALFPKTVSDPLYFMEESSASSVVSSREGSKASASSRGSLISASLPPSFKKRGRPRTRKGGHSTPLVQNRGPFQCTFCTETFRGKYEWKRHEKSLHIPLDRWACAPNGPTSVNPRTDAEICVFCERNNPDQAHLALHNHTACQGRVFNRKDHLKQHLRLVHDAPGVGWVIEGWKTATPEIRSRCGFCEQLLPTWEDRIDHLADHFKSGKTMASWTGDWGFEPSVMETVEHFMPPCESWSLIEILGISLTKLKDIIDHERHTPFPFNATLVPPNSPRTAYELLTLELEYFMQRHVDEYGQIPKNSEIQLEACCVIFSSEVLSTSPKIQETDTSSWLRDLIESNEDIKTKAKFGPFRSQAESRLSVLRINGKRTLFDSCPLELQLRDYVHTLWASQSIVSMDNDLQAEACRIVARMEERLTAGSPDFIANWLTKLMTGSTTWLYGFKKRTCLLSNTEQKLSSSADSSKVTDDLLGPLDLSIVHASRSNFPMHQNPTLVLQTDTQEEGLYLRSKSSSDAFLFEMDDPQSPHMLGKENSEKETESEPQLADASFRQHQKLPETAQEAAGSLRRPGWLKSAAFVLNDCNSHRWLSMELKRWAASTMSPNNPTHHVPSDEEIRHQARFLLFEE